MQYISYTRSFCNLFDLKNLRIVFSSGYKLINQLKDCDCELRGQGAVSVPVSS